MKLTDELLEQLIMEEMERLDEKDLSGYDTNFPVASKFKKRKARSQATKDISWIVGSKEEPYKQFGTIFNKHLSHKLGLGQTIYDLAQAAGGTKDNILNSKDIQAVVKNPDHPYHISVMEWANDLARWTDVTTTSATYQAWDASYPGWKDVHIAAKKIASELLNMSPEPTSDKGLGADSPTPEFPMKGGYATVSGRAKTPLSFVKLFNNILPTSVNMQDRFTRLREIAYFVSQKGKESLQGDVPKLDFVSKVSGIYALDILKTIVQDYEASSAGFLFENFLALMANGTIEGGNTKIDDFYIGADLDTMLQMAYDAKNGQPASAKLLKHNAAHFGGSDKLLSQFFEASPSGSILYVVGIKGQDLKAVDVHFINITQKVWNKAEWDSDRKKRKFKIPTSGAIKINLEPFKQTENYESAVKRTLDGALKSIGTVNQLVNQTRTSLLQMSTAKDVNERKTAALAALKAYNSLTVITDPVGQATNDAAGKSVDGSTDLGKEITKTKKRAQVTENEKLSEKLLDKLIKEVIFK